MMIAAVGAVGIGLVWGWLLGKFEGSIRRARWTVPALMVATAVVAAQVWWLVDWRAVAFFAGAATLAFFIHLAWRHELRARFARPTH